MTDTPAPTTFLAIIGVTLGASACGHLLAHRAHRRVWNAPLLAALGLLSLRQLACAAADTGIVPYGVAATTGTACLFLFWPALILYVLRTTSAMFGFLRAFVVTAPALVIFVLAVLLMPGRWFPFDPVGDPLNAPPEFDAGTLRAAPGVLIMVLYACFGLRRSWMRADPDGPAPSQLKKRWLRLVATGAAVIPTVMAAALVLDFVAPGLRGVTGLCYVAAEVAFLQLIVPAAMLNSRVLSEAPDGGELVARSVPSPAQSAMLKRHVLELMATERAYRERDLRVSDVAVAIGVPTHVLSSVINREFGSNFADFVNGYRIREAERLLLDPEFRQFTILSIALEVGFSSKAPFNRAFKRQTGLTPSEYQRRKLKERCGSN